MDSLAGVFIGEMACERAEALGLGPVRPFRPIPSARSPRTNDSICKHEYLRRSRGALNSQISFLNSFFWALSLVP